MKRRKILVLIPMLGLFLTGCTFQEGFATAKHWVGQNIYHPAKDFIEGLIGKKDSKEEEQPKEDDKPTPTPTPTPTEKTLVSVAVKDAPKKVEQGGTVDKSKVKLTATYSEGDPEEVTAEEVVCDTSKVAKEVEATAKYKGKEAKFTIEVTEKSTPVETEWKKLTAQPEVGKTYALILDREEASSNPGLWFLTGKAESEVKDGGKDYYLVTSQSEDDAAVVQVIAGEGGFKVKIGTRYLAMFETENNNKKYTNVGLKESESDATVLTYDETIGFYGVFNTDKNYGLGTRNDQAYTTVGAVDFSTHPENYKACLYEKENVTPVVPTVSSVTVSPDSLALEVGKPGQKLTAVVAGENNPSQEVTWHSDDEAIATVSEEGVVNAVAAGTAHITAKSVADTSKVSNACTVTVTQPTEEIILQSITVTGDFKKEYTEGDHLDLTGIVVTANYSDDTHPTVTDWTSVPTNGAVLSKDDTSLVVSYGGKPADAIALTINSAPVTQTTVYKFENEVSSSAADGEKVLEWLTKESGTSVIKGVGDLNKVYPGADGGTGEDVWSLKNSLKIGTSSAAGSIVFQLEDNVVVKSVTIKGFGWKTSLVVTAGNKASAAEAFAVASKTSVAGSASTVQFNLSYYAVGGIKIETNNTALMITEIDFETTSTPVHKVTFNGNGEGAANVPFAVAVESGSVTLADFGEPSREGYDFKGWSLTASGETVTSVTPSSSDIEVFAIWEEKAAISYEPCTLQEGQLLITSTYDSKDTYYLPTDTTGSAPTAVKFTAVSAISTDHLWTVTKSGDNWIFTNSEGKYLTVVGNDNNRVRVTTLSSGKNGQWKLNSNGSLESIDYSSRFLGVYNGSDWRSYNSASATNYKGSATALQFYKVAA